MIRFVHLRKKNSSAYSYFEKKIFFMALVTSVEFALWNELKRISELKDESKQVAYIPEKHKALLEEIKTKAKALFLIPEPSSPRVILQVEWKSVNEFPGGSRSTSGQYKMLLDVQGGLTLPSPAHMNFEVHDFQRTEQKVTTSWTCNGKEGTFDRQHNGILFYMGPKPIWCLIRGIAYGYDYNDILVLDDKMIRSCFYQ